MSSVRRIHRAGECMVRISTSSGRAFATRHSKRNEELLGPRLRLVWQEPDDDFLRFVVDVRHHGYLRALLLHVVLCDANLVHPYPFSWMMR